jgi:hypothetical protein
LNESAATAVSVPPLSAKPPPAMSANTTAADVILRMFLLDLSS